MDKKTIVIVDDHEIFREGIKFVLSGIPYLEVIAEASNGKEYLSLIEHYVPDLTLMDISMPLMDGIEATTAAIGKFPEIKIIALTMFSDQNYYLRMIQAGVKGFVLKKSGKYELINAIKAVIEGQNFFSQKLLRKLVINTGNPSYNNSVSLIKLSGREMEVLSLICNGLSNNEIAEKLNISYKTVDGHRTNLLSKTNSKNSVSLVMFAIRNKIVDI